MKSLQMVACALAVLALGCEDGRDGSDSGVTGPGASDPRCAAICDTDDARCVSDAQTCSQACDVRVAELDNLCATCLLEDVQEPSCGITLPGGDPPACCPDPDYRRSVVDCAAVCDGQSGRGPTSSDPRCLAICASDDDRCSADVSTCMAACQARIDGTNGLCATCLLEDVQEPSCGIALPGGDPPPCCPDPTYGRSVLDCASVCD